MFEIERKFLVHTTTEFQQALATAVPGIRISQVYLKDTGGWAIRVRRYDHLHEEPTFLMTMKFSISDLKCHEPQIAVDEAFYQKVADIGYPPVVKTRYHIPVGDKEWDVDVFHHPKLGALILAEVELESEEEDFVRPSWLGEEVTHLPEYRNINMAKKLAGEMLAAPDDLNHMLDQLETELGRVKKWINSQGYHSGTSINYVAREYRLKLKKLHREIAQSMEDEV